MRFQITPTPHLTKRVWVEVGTTNDSDEAEEKVDTLEKDLDLLALWHGADRNGKNYCGWEFDPCYEADVRELLSEYTEDGASWLHEHNRY